MRARRGGLRAGRRTVEALRFGFLVLMALLSVCVAPERAGAAEVRRFALVIGNNRPESATNETLRYADDDAVETHLLLAQANVDSLLFVTPDAATQGLHPGLAVAGPPRLSEVQRGFATLSRRMAQAAAAGARTEFILFYSGHGDVDGGEGYVVLEGERLTRSRLFDLLARSPASTNHVVVDACKSYFLVFERGPGGRRKAFGGSFAENVPAHLGNTGFVLSTSSDRESHEWERYQGGILSHELRSGLRGAADANLDGAVSYAELAAFIETANRAIPNVRFRPDVLVRPPNRDFERQLLSYGSGAGRLTFAPQAWGHFYVENARGERLLDAHPAPGQRLLLLLPSERPLFVRRDDERAETVISSADDLTVAPLSPTTPEVAARGALHLALRWIFADPFGDSDVQSFRNGAGRARAPVSDDVPPAPSGTRRTVALVSGITALGAGAAGLTLSALALEAQLSAQGDSQQALESANQRIQRLNRASFVCYGGALAAGLTWAWARFWPESRVTLSVAPTSRGGAAGLSLGVGRAF